MISVDLRTRRDDEVVATDADALFDEVLPAAIARHAALVLPGARYLAPRPLAIACGDRAWHLALDEDRILVGPHGGGGPTWVLPPDGPTDLACDLRTPMGYLTADELELRGGARLEDTLDWWVLIRAALDGRAAHTPEAVSFQDPDGSELDLTRAYDPATPDEHLGRVLAEAGFLHLRGVFSEEEMDAVSREMDEALPSYAPEDGRSWWARTAEGEHRAVRLQHFQERSPTTAGLVTDDRLTRIGRLTADGHRLGEAHLGGNVVEALIKPVGVVEGISDVPWHKDCSLGRHSYRCCSLTVGISVTGATRDSGQLRVVAGSHRALVQPAFVRRDLDLPRVDLPTGTGDVTVHLSCTLHMSQPPETRERRVLYTGFRLPPRAGEAERAGDRSLGAVRERAHRVVSQKPGHVG